MEPLTVIVLLLRLLRGEMQRYCAWLVQEKRKTHRTQTLDSPLVGNTETGIRYKPLCLLSTTTEK